MNTRFVSLSNRSTLSRATLNFLALALILALALAAIVSMVQAASSVPVLNENQNNVPASMPVYYIQMHSQPNVVTIFPNNFADYTIRYIMMHTPGMPVYELK
jgi:hypothetical protein